MRATIQEKEVANKKWLIPLIIFISSLLFEIFLGNTLFYHSHNSIISVQSFLNEKLGLKMFNNTYDPSKEINKEVQQNILLNYISFEQSENQTNKYYLKTDEQNSTKIEEGTIFSEVIHFFNTNLFFIIICAIAYNFVNIYKVFVLAYTIFLANFICSTLCFILHKPRPYMVYYSIKPAVMFNEWGSPDTQVVTLIAFSLTLYEIITKNKRMDKNISGKIIISLVIGLIDIIDIFLLFASGNISYNQIIFSIGIGVFTYQVIFLLFKVEVNKSEQLFNFLKFKTRYYLFINLILLSFQFILNFFIIDKCDEDYYYKNINEQQERLSYSEFLNKNFNYRQLFYLNKGNLCNVIFFSMNIVAFLSIKLELKLTYKGDYENWSSRNFEKQRQDQERLLDISEDDYIIRNATQWNHTGLCKGIVRLFFVIILSLLCLAPTVLIYFVLDNKSEANGYFFIITLPFCLITFGLFFMFKVLLKCLKLTKKN